MSGKTLNAYVNTTQISLTGRQEDNAGFVSIFSSAFKLNAMWRQHKGFYSENNTFYFLLCMTPCISAGGVIPAQIHDDSSLSGLDPSFV